MLLFALLARKNTPKMVAKSAPDQGGILIV